MISGNRNNTIRPLLRTALFAADCVVVAIAVAVSPSIGDIHTATFEQLAIMAGIILLAGEYIQFRYESARTFDFHDVVRLLIGACGGALLALLFEQVHSPLAHASGRLVVIAAMLSFVLRMFLRIGLVVFRTWWITKRPNADRCLIVGVGIAAHSVAKAIQEDRSMPMRVIGCVEDGISERRIDGVRVLGKLSNLPELVEQARHRHRHRGDHGSAAPAYQPREGTVSRGFRGQTPDGQRRARRFGAAQRTGYGFAHARHPPRRRARARSRRHRYRGRSSAPRRPSRSS